MYKNYELKFELSPKDNGDVYLGIMHIYSNFIDLKKFV